MLKEHGYTRAVLPDGTEFTFLPSFGRIASLGHPHEIVEVYVDLYGPRAAETADFVLACLCEQDDTSRLLGWSEPGADSGTPAIHQGALSDVQKLILARHLMQHGVSGKARAEQGNGEYTPTFEATTYVSLARVHLGLSNADAEGLSMTQFQALMDIKFPDPKGDVPDEKEYEAAMALIDGGKHD